MAKKGEKKDNAFVSALKDFGTSFLLGTIRELYEDFLRTVQQYAYRTQQRIIDSFIVLFMSLAGVSLMILSVIFLMNEYMNLGFGWSFLIVGLILFVISLVLKIRLDKKN
ncbi:hypothetical protein JXB31_03260 [Candidatus Woesearchaeota archaeon]|nr:hypothetical protein [Candidatus Woesearchaeota archaeon]